DKVYDSTTDASATHSDDRVSGDLLTDRYTAASFADKNLGTTKAVSVSGISIAGTDADNYALQNTTASTTANIAARPLTVTAHGENGRASSRNTASITL